jgi:hypothetical protein
MDISADRETAVFLKANISVDLESIPKLTWSQEKNKRRHHTSYLNGQMQHMLLGIEHLGRQTRDG